MRGLVGIAMPERDNDDNVVALPVTDARLDAARWDLGEAFSARIEDGICHGAMRHVGDRQCVTPGMLMAMKAYGLRLRALAPLFAAGPAPFRYLVLGAEGGGTFNLGGDLVLFRECLASGDRDRLSRYGHACVNTVYWNHRRYDLPVLTVAVVQGEALGGGFETVLSHDIVVAEEDAVFGLPEVSFNMFPGMGAYSFLSRRIGPARATQFILGGGAHSARDMQALGLVHHVVPNGSGYAALPGILRDVDRRYASHRAVYDLDRRVWPVTREELRGIVDLWVDTAFQTGSMDQRRMGKLISRQQARSA
jgi:DSF synthase